MLSNEIQTITRSEVIAIILDETDFTEDFLTGLSNEELKIKFLDEGYEIIDDEPESDLDKDNQTNN